MKTLAELQALRNKHLRECSWQEVHAEQVREAPVDAWFAENQERIENDLVKIGSCSILVRDDHPDNWGSTVTVETFYRILNRLHNQGFQAFDEKTHHGWLLKIILPIP
jgi:hypothetical protein